MNPESVCRLLDLKPHPEGGFYRQGYVGAETLAAGSLPPRYGGCRAMSTAIYYLITTDNFSALHRVASDEVFHFYAGDAVEMLHLYADGRREDPTLGLDLSRGERPQVVVPHGVWQGARVRPGGAWALLGTTVAPGFDFDDFEIGDRGQLISRFPQHREEILRYTRGRA